MAEVEGSPTAPDAPKDEKRNKKLTYVAIAIGAIGVVVTIIIAKRNSAANAANAATSPPGIDPTNGLPYSSAGTGASPPSASIGGSSTIDPQTDLDVQNSAAANLQIGQTLQAEIAASAAQSTQIGVTLQNELAGLAAYVLAHPPTAAPVQSMASSPPTAAAAPVASPAPAAGGTYTVKSGDSLSAIAGRYGMSWQTLYANNKTVVGSNPNLIKPGQVLKV